MENITMNRKEREQLIVFENLKNGEITQLEASLKVKLTTRWIRKKMERYLKNGAKGLIRKGRGRESGRQWSEREQAITIELLRTDWQGFGPTFAAEKLKELKGIKVSKETIRKLMVKNGLWQAKKKKIKHRRWRERRAIIGYLVQLDGSPHDWFEGRGSRCTLLVFIDDATSKILWLEFVKSESHCDVMRATKNYLEQCGRPRAFYTDFGSVFSVNLNNQEKDKKTQWERAMNDLEIEVKHAHSPQAKGRVERANGTLQDRLVKEMRLAGISSIESANRFLRESNFIEKHNERFAVAPAQSGNAHRSIDSYNLEDIFCIKEERILANDFTICYNKRIFQLRDRQPTIIRPKDTIIVNTHLNGTIRLSIRKVNLAFTEIQVKPQKPVQKEKIVQHISQKPSENSRRWVAGLPIFSKNLSKRRVG
jgi:hypothetical protein